MIIKRKGTKVAILAAKPGSLEYKRFVDICKVDSFPAILAIGKGCGFDVVEGKITEAALLASFMRATGPVSCDPGSCDSVPAGQTPCCPK